MSNERQQTVAADISLIFNCALAANCLELNKNTEAFPSVFNIAENVLYVLTRSLVANYSR